MQIKQERPNNQCFHARLVRSFTCMIASSQHSYEARFYSYLILQGENSGTEVKQFAQHHTTNKQYTQDLGLGSVALQRLCSQQRQKLVLGGGEVRQSQTLPRSVIFQRATVHKQTYGKSTVATFHGGGVVRKKRSKKSPCWGGNNKNKVERHFSRVCAVYSHLTMPLNLHVTFFSFLGEQIDGATLTFH